MDCGLATGTTLKFVTSGVEVIPQSIEYESSKQDYRHARVQITRAAGKHIHDNADIPEPVELYTAGRRLARLYLPVDALTLKGDTADLHLLDPRNTLGGATVDYKNDDVQLGELIDKLRYWILVEKANDLNPNGVITDVRPVNEQELVTRSRSWDDKLDEAVGQLSIVSPSSILVAWASEIPVARDIQHFALSHFNNLTGWLGEDGGVDWNEITVADALKDLEQQFEVASWVDDDGVLWIGPHETHSNLYVAGAGGKLLKLKESNITEDPLKVTESYVQGDYYIRDNQIDATLTNQMAPQSKIRKMGYAAVKKPDENKELYDTEIGWVSADEYQDIFGEYPSGYTPKPVGTLLNNGFGPTPEGKTITGQKATMNGDVLETQARRALLAELYDSKAGSLVVDGLASGTTSGHPHDIEVGDLVGVFPSQNSSCEYSDSKPTAYGINKVQHRLDASTGWEITLAVGMLPKAPIVSYSYELDMSDPLTLGNDPNEFYQNVRDEGQSRGWVDNLKADTQDAFDGAIALLDKYNPF